MEKIHSPGRPTRSDEDVNRAKWACIWSQKKSSPETVGLETPQTTVHTNLLQSRYLNPYKLQVVQKLTAHDRSLRQIYAHKF